MMPYIDQVLCNIEVTLSFEPYNSSRAVAGDTVLKLLMRKWGGGENWRRACLART